jgi:hypothetical protein
VQPDTSGVLSNLRFVYVGTDDTERDLAAYLAIPGARLRWRFQHFGADVAAVDVGGPPVLLLADHRPAPSALPIYAVDNLETATDSLETAGFRREAGPLGTPEGAASVLVDLSGNRVAILQVDRPGVMDTAYVDPANTHAVRSGTAAAPPAFDAG